MSEYDYRFWTENNDHQSLAQEYEQNITTTSPQVVTGLCRTEQNCIWHASDVQYTEYSGESLP